jgi:type I site-specific restriction endonuclease
MINFRYYQLNTISTLRSEIMKGKKRLIMCAPTGAG